MASDITLVPRIRVRQIHAQRVTAPVVRIRVGQDIIRVQPTLARQTRARPIPVRPITPVQRDLAAPIPAPHLIRAQWQVPVQQEIRVLLITLVLLHHAHQQQAIHAQLVILVRPTIRAGQGAHVARIEPV